MTSSYNKSKVNEVKDVTDDGVIKVGTKCRNGGCDAVSIASSNSLADFFVRFAPKND